MHRGCERAALTILTCDACVRQRGKVREPFEPGPSLATISTGVAGVGDWGGVACRVGLR